MAPRFLTLLYMPAENTVSPELINRRLETIIDYLERMNKRDRWRTIGGFFRSLIALIPLILLLWSTWYFLEHSEEIMTKIIEQTAQAASKQTQTMNENLVQELLKNYKK